MYSVIQTVALTCRARMVRLRTVFGQREAGSRNSGKVVLSPSMSKLALCYEGETARDRHSPGRCESEPEGAGQQ